MLEIAVVRVVDGVAVVVEDEQLLRDATCWRTKQLLVSDATFWRTT